MQSVRMNRLSYSIPSIVELGSVAELTLADFTFNGCYDGSYKTTATGQVQMGSAPVGALTGEKACPKS